MAVSLDVYSDNTATFATTFDHAGGTPTGVLVLALDDGSATVSGVTYGGEALTEIGAIQGVGELSALEATAWLLASGAPSGTQSVVLTGPTTVAAMVMSLNTASEPLESVDVETISNAALENPSATLALGGKTCFCAEIFGSGQAVVGGTSPFANWTSRAEVDAGSRVLGAYTYDIIGSTDVTAGWTQTADDALLIAAAVAEEEAGGTAVPVFRHHYMVQKR